MIVTTARLSILQFLVNIYPSASYASELTVLTGVSRSTMSRTLDALEKDGWILCEKEVGGMGKWRARRHYVTALASRARLEVIGIYVPKGYSNG